MKHLNKSKLMIWLTTGISLLAVFVSAVATLTWYQIDSQPIQTNIVTGSSDIDIQSVKGYKINQNLRANGQIDYSNNTVTEMDAATDVLDNTTNLDKEDSDVRFDVPTQGIGYYLVKPYDGSYRYNNTYDANNVPTGTTNATKFVEIDSGDASLAYIDSISLTTSEPFRIRKYTFEDNKTVNRQVVVPADGVTVTGAAAASVNAGGDVVVGQNAVYKVWLDYNSGKVGLEYVSNIPANRIKPDGPKNLYGTVTVYFNMANITWWTNDSHVVWMHLFGGSSTSDVKMTRINSTNYWKYDNLNVTTYPKVTFTRGTSSSIQWYGNDNQTSDQTFPTDLYDSNNCFKPNSGSGNLGGSWEKYGDSTFNFSVSTATVAATALEWSSADNKFVAEIDAKTNEIPTVTLNGKTVTYTPENNSNNNINYSTKKIKTGGTVKFMISKTNEVWVTAGYAIGLASTNNYASVASFTEMYKNPDNASEVYASINVTKDYYVFIQKNGANFGSSWGYNTAQYNNINSSKKIVLSATGAGCYLNTSTNKLWVEGNKEYSFTAAGDSGHVMSYVGSGTYEGWYSASYIPASGNPSDSLVFTLNGDSFTVTAASGTTNNFNGSTKKVKYGDGSTSVTVYLNTSNNQVFVTPIYSVVQKRSSSTIATLTASFVSGSTYRTASSFTIRDDDVFEARVNGGSYTVTASSTANNNVNSSRQALSDASSVYAELNVSSNTIWVSGYVAPTYYVSTNSGSSWTAMVATANADEYKKASVSVSAGTTLMFRRNGYKSLTVAAEAGERNNVTGSGSSVTIRSGGTVDIYLKAGTYPGTCNVWVDGFKMTTYFYNGDQNVAESTVFYASGYVADTDTWTKIDMTKNGRLFTLEIDVGRYTKMAFHQGTTYGSSSYKTNAITIDLSSQTNKYCRIDSDSSPFNVKWYNNAPSTTGSNKYYLYDRASSVLGGSPRAYAWHNSSETTSTYTYMQMGGSRFPGISMNAVIGGSMWVISVPTVYDRLLFAKSDGSKQSVDINISGHSNAGKVWIISSTTDGKGHYQGNYATDKTTSLGTANIKVNSSTITTMDIGDITKDDGTKGSNYFVYEHGIRAKHGDTLKIDVTAVTGTHDNLTVKVYDGKTFIAQAPHYLTVNRSTGAITVNFGNNTEAYGRFNFYLTTDGTISIVMVPDLGNGFYVIPYAGNTDGFIAASKMNSASHNEAVYAGFKATANQQVYVRSYVDSVDTYYDVINVDSSATGKVEEPVDGVIKFKETGYYTIEVTNGQVYVSKFNFNTFFSVNPLNVRDIGNQTAIKNQKTSLVLEVAFKTSNNKFPMSVSCGVQNDIYQYVGVNFYCSATKQSGYTFMRNSYYTLSNPSASYTVDNANSSFKTTIENGEVVYYAYILVDYVYSANLKNMPVSVTGALQFRIKTSQ